MADITTLGAHFAVRVNDGFRWALYHLPASNERDAHAAARAMWQSDPDKVRHEDEPMPDGVPEVIGDTDDGAKAETQRLAAELASAHVNAMLEARDNRIADLEGELKAAKADAERSAKNIDDLTTQWKLACEGVAKSDEAAEASVTRIHDLEAENAELQRSLDEATKPTPIQEPSVAGGGGKPA